jgi:hypothetical protein
MKRWGKLKPVRFDEKELKTDLGSGNFIFVGSSCDIFAQDIPAQWIADTLNYCEKFNNTYLFQTKNPSRIMDSWLPDKSLVCTTIETNRWYPEIMGNSPKPISRAQAMSYFAIREFLTIEPIMDFDLKAFIGMIKAFNPRQANIGADSGNNHLPEPSKEKILELIAALEEFTVVKQKTNLRRLL